MFNRAIVQSSMRGTVQVKRQSIKDLETDTEIPTSTSLRRQYIEFYPKNGARDTESNCTISTKQMSTGRDNVTNGTHVIHATVMMTGNAQFASILRHITAISEQKTGKVRINETMGRVRVSIAPVEQQYVLHILSVCMWPSVSSMQWARAIRQA